MADVELDARIGVEGPPVQAQGLVLGMRSLLDRDVAIARKEVWNLGVGQGGQAQGAAGRQNGDQFQLHVAPQPYVARR
ncbi:hypothetical protein D3C87_1190880 [compost metagenome]